MKICDKCGTRNYFTVRENHSCKNCNKDLTRKRVTVDVGACTTGHASQNIGLAEDRGGFSKYDTRVMKK